MSYSPINRAMGCTCEASTYVPYMKEQETEFYLLATARAQATTSCAPAAVSEPGQAIMVRVLATHIAVDEGFKVFETKLGPGFALVRTLLERCEHPWVNSSERERR